MTAETSSRANFVTDWKSQSRRHIALALLIFVHIVVCCVSLRLSSYYRDSYILYDGTLLHHAVAAVAAFALVSPVFVFTRFSFGYIVGFYFYTMILGVPLDKLLFAIQLQSRNSGDFRRSFRNCVSGGSAVDNVADQAAVRAVGFSD